ncbi:heterocyst-inhibiting signaling peptide PatS [Nodularia sp. UHCC 0506]
MKRTMLVNFFDERGSGR